MPPIIHPKTVTYTVQDLMHTLAHKRGESSPYSGRHVHFVGIGGSGMCGLAQMLLAFGAAVTGTDREPSAVTRKLSEVGATIRYEQGAEAVPANSDTVIYSAAIKPDHQELIEAQRRGLKIMKYAQLLGEVMNLKYGIAIAGTHGKSTTTALTAHILLSGGKDPSFVVGATVPQLGGSARSGAGEQFVVEACEYDRSFLNLHPKIGVVLNIEEDHLDYYRDIGEINEAFGNFMGQVDPAGVILMSAADVNCKSAARNAQAKVETFAMDASADWQAMGVRRFRGNAHFGVTYRERKMGRLVLSLAGRHNVGNALVAAAIATHCGVPWEKIQDAVENFRGADRRSQLKGTFNTASGAINLVDDYGHHPTEIRATLLALSEHYRPQRLICIFQPHQHSRTRFLLEDFAQSFAYADLTVMPDIYFVRDSEADRKAVTSDMLVEKIKQNGRDAVYISSFQAIADYVESNVRPGDLIVTMGAGPVWEISDELVRRFRGRGAN